MKLEKRSGGGAEPVEENVDKGKKPVVIYIMILFIAAFLLMAWSFASHQRSNTEALGRLQSSVTAMQEVQDLQDRVIGLQKELAETQRELTEARDALKELAQTQKELAEAREALEALEKKIEQNEEAVQNQTE